MVPVFMVAVALIGALGVAAMGVQNALMKGALKSFSQTTLMTGNLTQFTIDATEWLFPPRSDDRRERARLRKEAAREAAAPTPGALPAELPTRRRACR
jgi:uncharacterized membrane protein YoaK (UPF0700 family)